MAKAYELVSVDAFPYLASDLRVSEADGWVTIAITPTRSIYLVKDENSSVAIGSVGSCSATAERSCLMEDSQQICPMKMTVFEPYNAGFPKPPPSPRLAK